MLLVPFCVVPGDRWIKRHDDWRNSHFKAPLVKSRTISQPSPQTTVCFLSLPPTRAVRSIKGLYVPRQSCLSSRTAGEAMTEEWDSLARKVSQKELCISRQFNQDGYIIAKHILP